MDPFSTSERPENVNSSGPSTPAEDALTAHAPTGTPTRPTVNGQPDEAVPPPAPPLTPVAWLVNNSVYLLLFVAIVFWIYSRTGLEGVWKAALTILGLGLVIFIHELGHFVAAKWCDVHVRTFSIGFGPALPGCSFQRGETTYKIAILPLGGYVNMVGEGPEADEEEDYPRSFKNKTVGQRMLIISAGVVMNVLLGCLCFVIVYRAHGVERSPAIIWRTEAGSPAWRAGVRDDWAVIGIGKVADPWFDDLQRVVFSSGGQPIPFVFQTPHGKKEERTIEPRSTEGDMAPLIGVAPPPRLELPPSHLTHWLFAPPTENSRQVISHSVAAAAREVSLAPGDVVLKASDPDHGDDLTPLPAARGMIFNVDELCRRMRRLEDRPLKLEVKRARGVTEMLEVPAHGFDFGDTIVATTDPAEQKIYDPFRVKMIPPSPRSELSETGDPFAFRRRLKELAGKPMIIQVRRANASAAMPVNILVPSAYHLTFGMRLEMGEVAAVRTGSPAENAGLAPGDVIRKVSLQYDGDKPQPLPDDALDPVRLPHELAHRIDSSDKPDPTKWRVLLTVHPSQPIDHDRNKTKELPPLTWDDSWRFDVETPQRPLSPLTIPQLGIAYYVSNRVMHVQPGSDAARKGVQPGDEIEEISFSPASKKSEDARKKAEEFWPVKTPPIPPRQLSFGDYVRRIFQPERQPYGWPYLFESFQGKELASAEVKLQIKRGGTMLPEPIAIQAEPDRTWPLTERGLILMSAFRVQKANNLVEALQFGVERTFSFIRQIYDNLSGLVSGRISARGMGGPIEIASQAFSAAADPYFFLLFLGIISVNLAVVNFLPIPVLDGGHMVFLIYEKLRGRPPSETVRNVATLIGLAMIVSLMLFVIYLDVVRRFFGK